MTILSPLTRSGSSTDPRDPVARLEKLFDAGTMVPLHDRDKSGLLAAAGDIDGVHTVAYCSDATVMGGATNHRMRLDDGVLIKDNHIAANKGDIRKTVQRALDDAKSAANAVGLTIRIPEPMR